MKNTYQSIKAKNLVAFFILLFTVITVHSQTFQLSGSITDHEQQNLSGATILVKETGKGTTSNFDGEFNLNLAAGNYTVSVSYIGYVSATKTVSVTKNQDINFQLTESENVLEEVLVSATRANSKTPVTFTNITKVELESKNLGQDLPILLDQLPSVVTTSDSGAGVGYTGIRIRGTDATRINVTINGIPYNDAESQGTFWVNMPDFSSSIEDIQVQRGVGTSTNGAGAFGASINIKTQKPKEQGFASTSHTIGSYNTKKHNLDISTGLRNNLYAAARISKITSDGYIDRSASNLESYYLETGFITEKTKIKAIVFGGHEITNQAWYGTPQAVVNEDEAGIQTFLDHEGYSFSDEQIANLESNPGRTYNHYTYENEVDNYKQTHYQLHLEQDISEVLSLNLSGNYTAGEGYFEQFKPKEDVGDYFPDSVNADEGGEVIRRRWLKNDFYAFVYSLNYKKEKLDLTLGGGYNKYNGDHFGNIIWDSFPTEQIDYDKQYYFSDAEKVEFNTYLKGGYDINKSIYAFVDLQYRTVKHKSNGISSDLVNIDLNKSFEFFNPKAGITYTINKNNSAYVSFAVANREPNRDDLTKNPISPEPENLQDLELGYKFKNSNSYFLANVYYMNYNNQLVLTGEIDDVGDPIRQNVDESYRAGIELQAGYKFSNQLRLDANLTMSQNKIKEFDYIIYDTQYDPITFDDTTVPVVEKFKDTDIAFSPNVIAGANFTYTPINNLALSWISKYVGKQYLDNTTSDSKSISAYFVNNLNASYKINPTWIDQIAINLLINNILNEEYVANGYTYSYYYRPEGSNDKPITEVFYYPQATRNFLLGVTLKF